MMAIDTPEASQPHANFRKGGCTFFLEDFHPKAAIYRQEKPAGRVVAYEVHKIRSWPDPSRFNRIVPKGARLAGTSEWGSYGWTFCSRPPAERKFRELTSKNSQS